MSHLKVGLCSSVSFTVLGTPLQLCQTLNSPARLFFTSISLIVNAHVDAANAGESTEVHGTSYAPQNRLDAGYYQATSPLGRQVAVNVRKSGSSSSSSSSSSLGAWVICGVTKSPQPLLALLACSLEFLISSQDSRTDWPCQRWKFR